MINSITKIIKKHSLYLLSFFIPFIIMACYFAYRNMFPFGNSSILTVDLGQQYVDLFAYFRRTILSLDLHSILYSFSNGYGGEMIGIWGYYLLSPFNVILLLIPAKFINFSILLITLLKYGTSGLTFSVFLKHKGIKKNAIILSLSVAYALNGWMIANQLNVMWLDGVILLPIIIIGIDKILDSNKYRVFIISYTAMLVINYYIAYMITLFSIIYVISKLLIDNGTLKNRVTKLFKVGIGHVISLLLSSFIFLPNLLELKNGKAAYTLSTFKWKVEYNPLKMVSKLFDGSFNFSQMPNGYPNIFIGSIALIGFILFFCNKQIGLKHKIATFVITAIIIVSMFFEPLNLLWHAMQFPIWYPYRFSFIFCFWIIYIAAVGLDNQNSHISLKEIIVSGLILIAGLIYTAVNINSFNYMSLTKYLISLAFIAISFLVIHISNKDNKYYLLSLIIIAIGDSGLNAFNSLNSISYVSNDDYMKYTATLNKHVDDIKQKDTSFYRISKDFYRTRDDPIESNFFGGSTFSSTLRKSTPDFNSKIGNAYTTGSIDYSNGTLVTDSMLSFKYFINTINYNKAYPMIQKSSNRYDIVNNHIQKIDIFQIFKSNNAFPLIYTASNNIFSRIIASDPIKYQNSMVKQVTGDNSDVFNENMNYTILCTNTNALTGLNNQIISKNNLLKNGLVTIKYHHKNGMVPYLILPASMNQQKCSIKVNGEQLNLPNDFQSTFVVSLPNNKDNKITIKLLNGKLYTNEFNIASLNLPKFLSETKSIRTQNNRININGNTVSADVNISSNHRAVSTSIPYSNGWTLTVDGKKHPIKVVNDEFIGFDNLSKGNHKIKLSFYPSGLNAGILISLLALIFTIIYYLYKKKR
ncbi:YfhO family protein [Apilactobacillus nanyangensis]|uniref:YfhO family protein n=1 Tax=Apilactobacillus nanyangensis TaxID=2799579 RepID=A0ABT0HZ66_9LACO|nr:YfhO family protein [Apilactobacillus nanyangensis]MCK8612226.1 YfhO family protein [Apilactobacillus nanyangensis]TMT01663.1 YfhO family protein [Apilactobacillus kunkeei]TMT03804.1 YfhO family protein [Apilactobacillus kunkeei]